MSCNPIKTAPSDRDQFNGHEDGVSFDDAEETYITQAKATGDLVLKDVNVNREISLTEILKGISMIPLCRTVQICESFTNGTNRSMNVNGSSTSQDFTVGPPAGQIWYCHSITIFIVASGSTDFDDFGAIGGGLSNGVQLIQSIDSTEYVYSNFQNNEQLGNCFKEDIMFSSTAGEDTRGWFDEPDLYKGTATFRAPIELRGDDGDQLIFRIRDNITNLIEFTASGHFWRELS